MGTMTRTLTLLLFASLMFAGIATAQGPGGGRGQGPGRAGGPGMPPRDARPAQQAGTATIRGRIVAADTGAPVRRAQVRAVSTDARGSRLATTDADGRYELRDLPAGRWEISASKAGFVTLRYGQRRPLEAGRPIELVDAQVMDRADIALPRGAAITGRVYDEFGDPVAGARVQVLHYRTVQGARRLVPLGIADESDDTGAFRLFGLTPGDYYVSATLRAMRVDDPTADAAGYAPTYFPGTGNVVEAQRVTLGLGQELGNISFALLPVRTVRVSGSVIDSTGKPLTGGFLMLAPADSTSEAPMIFGGGGNVRGDGSFTLTNVAPGSYTLTVTTRGPGGGRFGGRGGTAAAVEGDIASVALSVGNEDMSGVTIATTRGATLSGTVVAAAGSGQAPLSSIQITTVAVPVGRGLGNPSAGVAANGTFTLRGLLGSRVIRVTGLPQNWMVQSIVVNGADVSDDVVEFSGSEEIRARVTITDRVTEVNGTVMAGNQPAKDYSVVIFPEDDTKWTFPSRYVRAARPDQQGTFRVRGLPPNGRYLAVAVDYLEDGEASDPAVLEQLATSGTRFSLGAGETRALDLRLFNR